MFASLQAATTNSADKPQPEAVGLASVSSHRQPVIAKRSEHALASLSEAIPIAKLTLEIQVVSALTASDFAWLQISFCQVTGWFE